MKSPCYVLEFVLALAGIRRLQGSEKGKGTRVVQIKTVETDDAIALWGLVEPVLKAHRLVYHLTLGLRVIKKKKKKT